MAAGASCRRLFRIYAIGGAFVVWYYGMHRGAAKESFILMRTVPSNHGREECMPVSISKDHAVPIPIKSGLITTLSRADGFFIINRDSEGIKQGERVNVILFRSVLCHLNT